MSRRNSNCSDGWEHQMQDGSWMCGKTHTNDMNVGGVLIGPSHEQGGIDAIVDNTEPIELEGGEFIINAETTAALGEDFLHKLNSTQTNYHDGGYGSGQLPAPSKYKSGGKVMRKRKPRTRPIPSNKRKGGGIKRKASNVRRPLKKGGNIKRARRGRPARRMQTGGRSGCPPGMTMRGGNCISMGNGGYRKGGKVKNRKSSVKKMRTGGIAERVMNTDVIAVKTNIGNLRAGQTSNNLSGGHIRHTRGGPGGAQTHQHTINVDVSGDGHTSADRKDGHFHPVKNGRVVMQCPAGYGCHSHEF